MKFDIDIGYFFEIYIERANLVKIGEEHRTLQEDLCMFHYSQRYKFAIREYLCNNKCFYILDSVM